MSSSMTSISLQDPAYFDGSLIDQPHTDSLVMRIGCVALPFIALYRPCGRVIALVMGAVNALSASGKWAERKDGKALCTTVIAIIAFAGTLFMHPLGLAIAALHDAGCDLVRVWTSPGEWEALLSCLQHLCYLGTMLMGSVEVVVVSLLFSMLMEAVRSRGEWRDGRFLEASAHALMSLVRGAQGLPYLERVAYAHHIPGKEWVQALQSRVAAVRDQASIYLYSSARWLVSPLWKSTELWLQAVSCWKDPACATSQKIALIAKSLCVSAVLLPMTLGGLALGEAVHFTAYQLATTPYIHVQGEAAVQPSSDQQPFTLFQLNCCLTAGGFARLFGGLDLPDAERVQHIADMIRTENPDLICLQEVSDLSSAWDLYHRLSSQYSEFYFHIGSTPFILQNNSGLFVASKVAIEQPEFHSFSDLVGVESMVNKGFFVFSTKMAHFINTHLSPSSKDLAPTEKEETTREEEQSRIYATVRARCLQEAKPMFVVGDFNTHHGTLFKENVLESSGNLEAVAETGYLVQRNWHQNALAQPEGVSIDHVLMFSSEPTQYRVEVSAKATFDVNDPKAAISDHPALVSNVSYS